METLHILESRRRVQEEQMHRDVQIAFQLANAIGNRIGFLFKKPEDRSEEDLLQPWDVFPDLFKLDKIHAEEEMEARLLAQQKARLLNAAARNNERRRQNG